MRCALGRYTFFPMDFFSEVLQGLSELLIQFILISLAFGWTIIPNTGEQGGFFKVFNPPLSPPPCSRFL